MNNVISGQTALGATADQTDELFISDGGTLKKITVSNLEDTVFGNVSGDATVAAGGAMTLAGAQTNVTSLKNASLVVGAASEMITLACYCWFYSSSDQQCFKNYSY